MEKEENQKGGEKTNTKQKVDTETIVQGAVILILAIVVLYQFGVFSGTTGAVIGIASAKGIIPTGTPAVYGSEIGITYDEVSPNNPALADAAIKKLTQYESMQLDQEQMQRYIDITLQISCEYCCGAKSIIFENGQAACGCAHSFAMRGLGKYLVVNHPEMSDDEILSEIGKWKVLFFPGIHEQKAQALEAAGIDSKDYINLASNKYRGIEKGQQTQGSGGMVGGC